VALGAISRSLAYVPGVSVFMFYPVLSLGGCKFIWVVALTVVAAMYSSSVCSWFLHCIHCRAFVILFVYTIFNLGNHVVVHLAIKYTYVTQLYLTIYNFQVSHTHTHDGDDTLPRWGVINVAHITVLISVFC
jgi:hypothetical protein